MAQLSNQKIQDGWWVKQQNTFFSFVYKNLILDLKMAPSLKWKNGKKYSEKMEPESKLW